ncbi:MAG: 30S ribosomal protein S2 [Candidatus Aenigmarchaeota archaeon]|nr:30S ribosomal protein S2 [Candidatus Aenigmarchaeota archaeon]MDW8149742.1 30S ribosomal protein S2 [Candidatus Aenigmarchaeota archaeon]
MKDVFISKKVVYGSDKKTTNMEKFIVRKIRNRYILNKKMIQERIKVAAKFLSGKKILLYTKNRNLEEVVKNFAEALKIKYYIGRFLPGTLTNPQVDEYYEADVLFVLNPKTDIRAIKEASIAKVPVVAICNSDDVTSNIDLIIPGNNKQKSSISMILNLILKNILPNIEISELK